MLLIGLLVTLLTLRSQAQLSAGDLPPQNNRIDVDSLSQSNGAQKASKPQSILKTATQLLSALYPPIWLTRPIVDNIRTFIRKKCSEQPKRIAELVRLAFHTCAGPEGCNGCIDKNDPGNRGLETIIGDLQTWRKQNFYNFFVTTADFVALASCEAAQIGLRNAGCSSCSIECKLGRQTCSPTSPKVNIPEGHKTDGVQRLQTLFGLTRTEVVCLLGFGHSLGGCFFSSKGNWDNTTAALDNRWFLALRDHDFTFEPEGTFRQFRNDDKDKNLMMLAVDLKTGWDVNTDDNGKPDCPNIRSCPAQPELFSQIFRLAGDQAAFFKECPPVFIKMIETSKDSSGKQRTLKKI